jgi:biopolymer transport protein ExbB/TolQ
VFEVVTYFILVSFSVVVQLWNRKLKIPEQLKKKELKPVSVYTDLEAGNPVEYLTVLFVQLMLYLLVAGAVYNQDKVKEFTFQHLVFYVGGALVSSVLRAREHSFYHTEYKPFWEPYCEECWEPKRKLNFRFRLFCSLLANEIFSQAVLILLPVVLMNAPDLMEFVKDATCVAFISQMDNLQNVADDQVMINEKLEANQKLQEERLEANQKLQEQLKEMREQPDKHTLSLILKQLHEEQKKVRELMQQEKELKKELQALVEKEQAKQKEFQEGVKNQLNTLTVALHCVSRTSAAGDAPSPHSHFSPVSRSPAVPDAS